MIVNSSKYFVDRINSSKANKFTAYYHYSRQGFKKAQYNLGVFRQDTKKMVGCIQWGISAAENIKLNRYVKEPITKASYLELNRFCMDDEEGKNSESQAISLGIKWVKKNLPHIKLLVSYAGRKEGNYGYIYQATNWEYLGYFISNGFWWIDGWERHAINMWFIYTTHCDTNKDMITALCDYSKDLRQTWTKQFIYIQRLDPTLTVASPVLPYPKPSTDYPIKTNEKIYKEDAEIYNNPPEQRSPIKPDYDYVPDELLFTKRTLRRRGELQEYKYVVYDTHGILVDVYEKVKDIKIDGFKHSGVLKALRTDGIYKDYHIIKLPIENDVQEEIEVPWFGIVDEIAFVNGAEMGRYLGCSRQAICQARHLRQSTIMGKQITWEGADDKEEEKEPDLFNQTPNIDNNP